MKLFFIVHIQVKTHESLKKTKFHKNGRKNVDDWFDYKHNLALPKLNVIPVLQKAIMVLYF